MQITENAPIEVNVYRSRQDGALVIEIDTQDDTGDLRVNLNDAPIWDGDPESTTGARELLLEIHRARHATTRLHGDEPTAEQDAVFRLAVERILQNAKVSTWTHG